MNINRNNYEEFFLLLLDGELDNPAKQEVEKFLNENADLQKEFALLQDTILVPIDILFDRKDLLLRKEEKRKVVPFFWLRMAAAIALLVIGSWIVFTLVTNHSTENSGKRELSATHDALKKAGSTIQAISKNNPISNYKPQTQTKEPVNHSKAGELANNKDQKNSLNPIRRNNPEISSVDNVESKEETVIAQQKTGIPGLQSDESRAGIDPRQVSVASGIKPSALAIAAVPANDNIKNENRGEPNEQTDNAISVIALNDQNKSITGFFKKLTKRNPADENTRKVRVSVFQFSY